MGTRNLTVVTKNNEYKVAQYCQWDGYPSGVGLDIVRFIRETNMSEFSKKIDKVKFLTDDEVEALWNKADTDPSSAVLTPGASDSVEKVYPQLVRNTGPRVLGMIYSGDVTELQSSLEFAADSLFCEWAYVINLDNSTLEVYEGFNKTPLSESDRFYFLQEASGYYPVKLVGTFTFEAIKNEMFNDTVNFVEVLEPVDAEEED